MKRIAIRDQDSRRIRGPHALGHLLSLVALDCRDVELTPKVEPKLRAIAEIAAKPDRGTGPKNMPTEIVDLLIKEINAGLARPEVKARYDELGLRVFAASPAEFGEHIAAEVSKWTKVIKSAGIKAQ